jgi:hypothetical protein
MTSLRLIGAVIVAAGLLTGCAQEDDSIVNPVPGRRRITMRLFNFVPDAQQRRLVMEEGFASADVPMFGFSDTVQSPGDSTLIKIVRGQEQEFLSPRRVPFIPNTSYNLYAVSGPANPGRFDTVLISNANTPGSALGYAQVRIVNMHADPARSYELRLGCPSGNPVLSMPTAFRQTSQFREVFPGNTVFSLVEYRNGQATVLGTFETTLRERRTYSLVIHEAESGAVPELLFIEESDLSSAAQRPFSLVSSRTADVRVINLSSDNVDVEMPDLGTNLAKGLSERRIGDRVAVTTCEQQRADRIEVRFASGARLADSASLVVRNLFSVIVADSGSSGQAIVAPMIQRPLGSDGKAVIRVIHASASTANVRVSTSTRSSSTSVSGIQPAVTLAQKLGRRGISGAIAVEPGQVPLTITSETTPTALLRTSTLSVQPDRSYDLILHDKLGELRVAVVEQESSARPADLITDAALLTFVHGAPGRDAVPVRLGSAISAGRLNYGGTLTTCLEQLDNAYSIDGLSGQLEMRNADRTLVVYGLPNNAPTVLQYRTLPLLPAAGRSIRRVVNATRDVPRLTVSVDSIAVEETSEALARNLPMGEISEPMVTTQDRRGTYYFFNAESREKMYTLPVRLATLGNNFTLVVVGEKTKGYDVIVIQEL